jgi:hypothetical protein
MMRIGHLNPMQLPAPKTAAWERRNVCEWVEVLTDGDKFGCHLLLLPSRAQIYMQDAACLSDASTAVYPVKNGGLSAEKTEATRMFA